MAKATQTMKAATAAKKLQVYLPATPAEFQESAITREQYDELVANPPAWLVQLREDGPHPRSVIASRLNVSISGLARGGVTEALTTAQIQELLAEVPEWLRVEQNRYAEVRREQARLKSERAARSSD
ncbi:MULTISPECIES: DUF5997 family protein [unclassified Rathayibacter]|uniref:DUF5997 family protein n=1 Tax=unclassified Rathayibacter TaxID=2609250 RepID=UPI00188B93C2|nr:MULTISPECIES: DUF5997 family protein [unclassified Rathayibacter]MBF4462978.1 hypothetical protein [Rathayibacter sp. VKM Ac-2879]MBF4504392.1 hypothetical protein [Rathayibacter sp. VKM Ac-2878]